MTEIIINILKVIIIIESGIAIGVLLMIAIHKITEAVRKGKGNGKFDIFENF